MNNNIINLALLNPLFNKNNLYGGSSGKSLSQSMSEFSIDNPYKIIREWNGETELIIGCGNSPPIMQPTRRDEHKHENAYTIDIDPEMNPSCLTDTQLGQFCKIPDNSIERIICEGFVLSLDTSQEFIREIKRIKTEDAYMECDFKAIGTFRNSNGSWDNIYDDSPFINFDDLDTYNGSGKVDFLRNQNGTLKKFTKDAMGKEVEIKDVYIKGVDGSEKVVKIKRI